MSRTWSAIIALAGVLLAGALAWRLAGSKFDSPYISTEIFQMALLTDEGYYSKPALTHARFGEFYQSHDFNTASTAFLHTLAVRGSFALFGDRLQSARFVSTAAALLGLFAFWTLCRRRLSRGKSAAAVAAVALNLVFVAYSRIATAESLAISLSICAIAIWARTEKTWWAAFPALLVAVIAVAAKQSYIHVLAAIGVMFLYDAWRAARLRQFGRTAAYMLGLVAAAVAVRSYLGWVHDLPNSNADFMIRYTLHDMAGYLVSFGTAVRWEMRSFLQSLPILAGAATLIVAGLVLAVFHARSGGWPRLRPIFEDRTVWVLALWTAGGAALYGITWVQAARYYLFAVYAAAYLCFRLADLGFERRIGRLVAVLILAAHLAGQAPLYLLWASQAPQKTAVDISSDIAQRITRRSAGEVRIMGNGLPAFIAMFDHRIRPIDIGYFEYNSVEPREQRLRYWRPEWLIVNDDDNVFTSAAVADLVRNCSDLVDHIDIETEYTHLFRNAYSNAMASIPNLKLVRVSYKPGAVTK